MDYETAKVGCTMGVEIKRQGGFDIMNIEKTLITPGERLRRARVLAGLATRREFEMKYRISANTLQGWEQGKNPLSEKGAKRVVEAFNHEGLICTLEWLLHGTGMPPRPYEMLRMGINAKLDNPTKNLEQLNLQEEECIYKETQLFREQYQGSIVLTVVDDSMSPYFKEGDHIGGVQVPNETLDQYLNELCILELEHNVILPRLLQKGSHDGVYTASCTNPTSKSAPLNLIDVKIISAAPIVWHRKKLSSF